MSFAPPKSVSVLWTCADEAVAAEVLAAHESAVEVALAFLDEHAAFTIGDAPVARPALLVARVRDSFAATPSKQVAV